MKDLYFIEVGGHHGKTTDLVLERSRCKVIVFEPNPALYSVLWRQYLSEVRATVINAAVWNRDGQEDFHSCGHSGASSMHADKLDLGETEHIEVRCTRIVNILKRLRGRVMLNLNCEGAELEIMADIMDSEAFEGVKTFCKTHEDKLPNPERYDTMLARMDSLGVDYWRGMYSSAWNGILNNKEGLDARGFLAKQGKEHWLEFFTKE